MADRLEAIETSVHQVTLTLVSEVSSRRERIENLEISSRCSHGMLKAYGVCFL